MLHAVASNGLEGSFDPRTPHPLSSPSKVKDYNLLVGKSKGNAQ